MKNKHKKQVEFSPQLTDAEIQIINLLPDKYLLKSIESINIEELIKDPEVIFYQPLMDHYLKTYAYPQIKVPTKLFISKSFKPAHVKGTCL